MIRMFDRKPYHLDLTREDHTWVHREAPPVCGRLHGSTYGKVESVMAAIKDELKEVGRDDETQTHTSSMVNKLGLKPPWTQNTWPSTMAPSAK